MTDTGPAVLDPEQLTMSHKDRTPKSSSKTAAEALNAAVDLWDAFLVDGQDFSPLTENNDARAELPQFELTEDPSGALSFVGGDLGNCLVPELPLQTVKPAEKISVSNAEGRAENLILSTASFQTASIQTSSGNSDSLQQKIELCVAKVNNLYSRLVGSLGLKVDPLCEVGKGAAVKNSSQRGEPVKLQQATREATRAVEEEDFAFDPFDLPLGPTPKLSETPKNPFADGRPTTEKDPGTKKDDAKKRRAATAKEGGVKHQEEEHELSEGNASMYEEDPDTASLLCDERAADLIQKNEPDSLQATKGRRTLKSLLKSNSMTSDTTCFNQSVTGERTRNNTQSYQPSPQQQKHMEEVVEEKTEELKSPTTTSEEAVLAERLEDQAKMMLEKAKEMKNAAAAAKKAAARAKKAAEKAKTTGAESCPVKRKQQKPSAPKKVKTTSRFEEEAQAASAAFAAALASVGNALVDDGSDAAAAATAAAIAAKPTTSSPDSDGSFASPPERPARSCFRNKKRKASTTPFKSGLSSKCIEWNDDNVESPLPEQKEQSEKEAAEPAPEERPAKARKTLKRATLSSILDRASSMPFKSMSTQMDVDAENNETSNQPCPVETKLKTLKIRTGLNSHKGISLNSRVHQSPMKRV